MISKKKRLISSLCLHPGEVLIDAETGAKAKNKAITAANKGFVGFNVNVVGCNLTDELWGINNFPELKWIPKLVGLAT